MFQLMCAFNNIYYLCDAYLFKTAVLKSHLLLTNYHQTLMSISTNSTPIEIRQWNIEKVEVKNGLIDAISQ